MDVSENSGTPKSSNLIGISIINHPFWGIPIFGNSHIFQNGRSSLRLHFRSHDIKGRECLRLLEVLGNLRQ